MYTQPDLEAEEEQLISIEMLPDLAPDGTVATILVEVTETLVPVTPPNFTVTALEVEPNPVPIISTL